MSLEALKNRIPDYARDLKLNLSSLATEAALTDQQRGGTFIAAALASRNAEVINALTAEFAPRLTPEAVQSRPARNTRPKIPPTWPPVRFISWLAG